MILSPILLLSLIEIALIAAHTVASLISLSISISLGLPLQSASSSFGMAAMKVRNVAAAVVVMEACPRVQVLWLFLTLQLVEKVKCKNLFLEQQTLDFYAFSGTASVFQ